MQKHRKAAVACSPPRPASPLSSSRVRPQSAEQTMQEMTTNNFFFFSKSPFFEIFTSRVAAPCYCEVFTTKQKALRIKTKTRYNKTTQQG